MSNDLINLMYALMYATYTGTYLYHNVYIVHVLNNDAYLHSVNQIIWGHFAFSNKSCWIHLQ